MELDRATQIFVTRFNEPIQNEAQRLRREGAIKQIFGGPAFIQARVEDGSDVYRITIRKERSGLWAEEVRGPENQHPAAVCAVMLERIDRGDALPESPNEVDNLSITQVLEEKLARELSPDEDRFVDKLEKRYKKFTLEDQLFDTDMVRINPKWPVESFEPITLWPTPPTNIVEFWNYVASAMEKRRLTWPKFMNAVTDKEATQDKLKSWEDEREQTEWQGRFDSIFNTPELVPETIVLRIRATTREARLQCRRGLAEDAVFENVPNDIEAQRIAEQLEQGLVRLDPLSEILWQLWSGRSGVGMPPVASMRLEDPSAAKLMSALFRQTLLGERILTLDELPFHRSDDSLRWECAPVEGETGKDAAKNYQFQLLMPDGDSVPYDLVILPGKSPLYMSDDAVFPGPPPWTDATDISPRNNIPRHILETEQGLEFLRRLHCPPPAELLARSEQIVLLPTLDFRLAKKGADSEVVYVDATAADGLALRREQLDRDHWKVIERQPLPDGKLAVIDRSRLTPILKHLDVFGFTWESATNAFRFRITKTFPEKFVAWLDTLPAEAEIVLDNELKSLRADPIQAAVRFELAESPELDWFDLKVLVDVQGQELTKAEIRELVAARGGFVRMPNGRWMRLDLSLEDEQKTAITRLGLDVYDLSGETHRMHALQLADPGAKEVFDERAWERICERANSLKIQIKPDVPPGLALELRPYQVDGFHFLAYLASNRFGGLLADDMGLGKTAQSITWILWLRQVFIEKNGPDATILPTLVVAPKSVLDVWAGEVKKFSPQLRVHVIRVKEDLDVTKLGTEIDILVMNYSQLRVNVDRVKDTAWLATILDEGQQIKNPDSMAARAARQLQSEQRLVLSGTPIENRLLDVWSLMAFAMPGVLGNRKYFKDRFDRRKDPEAQVRLSARLRPFILRRTKGQVALDLPPRTEEEVYCKMEDLQEELYAAELAKMQRMLLGMDNDASVRKNSFAVLQGLMRLRQICCHPALIDPQHDDSTSTKMTGLFYLLDQLREEGHKVLVFSQFVTMLEIIQKRLIEQDRPHIILTGQSKDRGGLVEKFQTSKDPTVFLLSLKAGGSGLNLTAASYVVLYDPWWNPAVENQAIDRTHRIGQTNPVIAYRLLIRNSVEEKIRKLQQQKQMLFTGVLGEESFSSNLKLDDLNFLFSREA